MNQEEAGRLTLSRVIGYMAVNIGSISAVDLLR